MVDIPSSPTTEMLFEDYLARLGISEKTFKNYRSDISHFSAWLILRVRSYGVIIQELSEAVPFLSVKLADEYKNFMAENSIPPKTLNRRLSTIRHLAKFFFQAQILDFDFMQGTQNISLSQGIEPGHHRLIAGFRKHLESQNVAKNTIKNYVSDVRQFLSWLEQKQVSSS